MKVWPVELRCSCGEHDGWQLEASIEAAESFAASYFAGAVAPHTRTADILEPIEASRTGWTRALDNPAISVVSLDDRRCRSCGCTEFAPCVTGDIPCHWVAPDLCSACA